MNMPLSRRSILVAGGLALGAAAVGPLRAEEQVAFRYSLNASTLFGQKLALPQFAEIASKAGYDGIEPWVSHIDSYVKKGGSLAELKKRFADLNLSVENGIGFAAWIVNDDAKRKAGLEQFKRDMDLIAQLGGKRIAAPPVGATDVADMDFGIAAERYRVLMALGKSMGVTPQLELWGGSKTMGNLADAAKIAMLADVPGACILADVYHMYKGGSGFALLGKLPAGMIQMLHMNDYPAEPPRAQVQDKHRVYPGDGTAPFAEILDGIRKNNPRCVLSLELFNQDYWKQDAATVAKTGLEKMKAVVKAALG